MPGFAPVAALPVATATLAEATALTLTGTLAFELLSLSGNLEKVKTPVTGELVFSLDSLAVTIIQGRWFEAESSTAGTWVAEEVT